MKTHLNNYQKTQALNNKIMLISILIFGSVLVVFACNDFIFSNYPSAAKAMSSFNANQSDPVLATQVNEDKNMSGRTVMVSLVPKKACVSNNTNTDLETSKLKRRIKKVNHMVYVRMLNTFSEVDEPELLIADVLPLIQAQRQVQEKHEASVPIMSANVYLDEMYRQKNDRVGARLYEDWILNSSVTLEKEDELKIEGWMTAGLNLKSEKSLAPYLKEAMNKKNRDISELIQYEYLYNEYLTIAKEEPLKVEKWMVDARCWCPEKMKSDWYKESFAMMKK